MQMSVILTRLDCTLVASNLEYPQSIMQLCFIILGLATSSGQEKGCPSVHICKPSFIVIKSRHIEGRKFNFRVVLMTRN
jgi:hypothetical protein